MIDFIIFAYEPLKVDNTLELDKIKEDITEISNYLLDLYEARPTIIYGGGVANKDVKVLLNDDNIDGLLIGKVSTNIESTLKIIKTIN